ncbi:uncharacterized protein [Branchiostoma lanceolatum]|uniref:uncharacterized protein n=1 Tax=Branchiostoma lanceolatum TaxID=7740 RepID=UPI003452187A
MMAAGQRSQASFDFCHNPHAGSLLQGLQELRSDSLLVDVILCCSGKEIPCHRTVLSAFSGYFRGMFCNGHRESKQQKIDIHGVSPDTLQLLVDYAYTSKVTITEGNAVKLLEGSNFFQIQPVFDACARFISEHLHVKNCLEMVYIARMLSPNLYKKVLSYVIKEFTAVSKRADFLDLTKDQLTTIISSDDLNALEETVYTAVMTWINHDTRNRQKDMRELMELVRFPLMDKLYFVENVQTNRAVCTSCQDIVTETLKYQLFPGQVQSPRTRPRGLKETVVVIGGQRSETQRLSNFFLMTCSTAPFSSSSWVGMTRMKHDHDQGFAVGAVAVLGTSDIIVSAGYSFNREVWMYQLELNKWSKLSSMRIHKSHHKLAVQGNKVYAIGGLNDSRDPRGLVPALPSVEVYDRSQNEWTEGVPLPQPRYKHAVAVVDNIIYVMGGSNEHGVVAPSTVYSLSSGGSKWHQQTNMPFPAADVIASVLNGTIYVAGIPSTLLCYKPGESGGCWSVVANTVELLSRCGMTVYGGKVYIYGGCNRGSLNKNGSPNVLCFDPETLTLKRAGSMNKGLYGHACVTILKAPDTEIPQVRSYDKHMMAAGQRSEASFDFCNNPHATSLLHGLQELRSESLLVDVVLCVSGKEIPCHRTVLSACSGYFRGMFCYDYRETKEQKVDIHGVSPDTLQLLVDYAYTSKVTITEGNAVKLLEGSNFFQIRAVFDACARFISEHLCAKNCLEMVHIGCMLSQDLMKKALSYVMKEFAAVSKTAKFLDLTKDQLITLISSEDLNASEETVYMAVMTWINYDTSNRQKVMRELLELVRFPLMDKLFFLENVQNNEAVRKSCQDIVTETLRYQLFPGQVQSPCTHPRIAGGLTEAVVVIGGILGRGRGRTEASNSIMMTCSTAPFSSSSWVPMTRMKYYYDQGFAVAVLGTSDIIVSAGYSSYREVWMYQLELNKWSKLAPMNCSRHNHKLAVLQGKLYAIGGKLAQGTVEVYDRSQNEWTEGVPLPQPRYKHAVAVVDDSIYVMGGFDADHNSTSTVYCLSPGQSMWQPQSNMPEQAADITASVLHGNIYVAGIPTKVLCYKPGEKGGCWSVVARTNDALRRCGMTVCGRRVYIYGGYDEGGGSTRVMCLNPETMSLERVGCMHQGLTLYGHACVTVSMAADTRIPQVMP